MTPLQGADMKTIRLLPANKRLKQLIKFHGNQWHQINDLEFMPCFNHAPGVRIRSLDGKHERNVLLTNICDV